MPGTGTIDFADDKVEPKGKKHTNTYNHEQMDAKLELASEEEGSEDIDEEATP